MVDDIDLDSWGRPADEGQALAWLLGDDHPGVQQRRAAVAEQEAEQWAAWEALRSIGSGIDEVADPDTAALLGRPLVSTDDEGSGA